MPNIHTSAYLLGLESRFGAEGAGRYTTYSSLTNLSADKRKHNASALFHLCWCKF